MTEAQAEEIANGRSPVGYTLWAVYVSQRMARERRRLYGCRSDVIKSVPDSKWWALYGLAA